MNILCCTLFGYTFSEFVSVDGRRRDKLDFPASYDDVEVDMVSLYVQLFPHFGLAAVLCDSDRAIVIYA